MSDARNYKRSRQAWELAGRQHGIVARRQLLALGFNAREIEHRIERGRLHIVMRGVYAVGWPQLTSKRRWMAAVLACGEGAMLSHRSAAALWEIGKEKRHTIDVSVARRAELKRQGLRVRGRPSLTAERITIHDCIPVTAPVQTLIDLSTELAPRAVERAVNFRLSDSDLEILFRPIAAAAGLPPPLTKQIINGFEVDFFFPDLGLVVETDGLRYHRTPSTQTHDAKRDRAHTLAGMTPLRFTHYEIKYERARVCAELSRVAARLAERIRY
jgi:very-short-patch-repair endonuclease